MWNRWKYYFIRRPRKPCSTTLPHDKVPHVTAIRPVKGLEPYIYDCLASTFRQDYPRDKLTVHLCVSTRRDPAFPILQRAVADFPDADARVYVEEEDPLLQQQQQQGRKGEEETSYPMGPNPKIRNMSRGYREAKGDIVWIIDCNVWVGKGVCGRMVDRLCGFSSSSVEDTTGKGGVRGVRLEREMPYKFVHLLPVVVDVDVDDGDGEYWASRERGRKRVLLDSDKNGATETSIMTTSAAQNVQKQRAKQDEADDESKNTLADLLALGGGRLEELFLSSAHAKMYTAINTVLIAPCIVGKSNMFRRSHLNPLTVDHTQGGRNPGIDYFSDNICEDHLIGDLLWRKQVPEEKESGKIFGKHAMVFGDIAIQPAANMSVHSYIARRVRWLRVRKFTVLLATLVEPGTESLVCSLYGAWGLTTAIADLFARYGNGNAAAHHLSTWKAFTWFFAVSMLSWILVDWTLYIMLHSARSVEVDEDTPSFAKPTPPGSITRRPFIHWFIAWLGREFLALPIWMCAVYGGVTVSWRDRQFKVGFDAKVREIGSSGRSMSIPVERARNRYSNGNGKVRQD